MGSLIHTVALVLGIGAIMGAAQIAAAWLAPRSWLQVKPFNCGACLTFWLSLAVLFGAFVNIYASYDRAALDALTFAFINFFYIKTKIQIYE